MDKDFIENNNLEKILKNYLKQENMTINTLSKESKIKLETIKKILENSYNKPHRATLEKLYNLNKLNLDDKECIKNLIEKKIEKKSKDFDENIKKYENLLNKIDSLIEENETLKEKVRVYDLSKKENDDYFTRRKIGAFDSDLQSNSLLITKIWDFNKNILKEWADVKLLLDINDRAKTQKMKKGLKSIVKDFKKIAEYLEDICFDSSEIKEDEVIIIDEKNGKKE
ncbi:hypothetical protein [Fusobacterium polymorphum]|uniref:hypothetical protein n=1 Tax=Fusobacterium nucleatum subsp. polymorphum TaxID=76857 RepID=UPI000BFDC471|nr:hypothetical protein [Fusobacterium polymorphum]PHI04711.1 hypothetical protein CA845_06610 [Fusobacterium polymorphum]